MLSTRLRYVDTEHKANPGVFPAHVRLTLPQLDVRISELEDPGAVDSNETQIWKLSDERTTLSCCFFCVFLITAVTVLTLLSCCSLAPAGSQGLWCH